MNLVCIMKKLIKARKQSEFIFEYSSTSDVLDVYDSNHYTLFHLVSMGAKLEKMDVSEIINLAAKD